MKAFFLCLMAMMFFFAGNAQVDFQPTVGDTITNTETGTVKIYVPMNTKQTTIQAIYTKISGTVAGHVTLQASLDGVNYSPISTDTLTMSNIGVNTKIWSIDGNPYIYYRLQVVGVGTQSGVLKGKMLRRL